MIKVDRGAVPLLTILTDRDGVGARETRRAIAFYAVLPDGSRPNRDKVFRWFKAYRDRSIREALEKLFHGKCAYCEERYAGTQPMDVEHWRPKGMIVSSDGTGTRPGYYWLAASWDNLLPSCIDCNRRRWQPHHKGGKRLMGKANRFPLEEGSPRATGPDEESQERPLLLNPCDDEDPGDHLEFVSGGVVRPRLSSGEPSRKAVTSIEIYGLNRTPLVQDRHEVLLLIRQRERTITRLAQLLDSVLRYLDGDQGVDADRRQMLENLQVVVEDLLSHEMVSLKRFCRPESPFALMARQRVERFLEQFDE